LSRPVLQIGGVNPPVKSCLSLGPVKEGPGDPPETLEPVAAATCEEAGCDAGAQITGQQGRGTVTWSQDTSPRAGVGMGPGCSCSWETAMEEDDMTVADHGQQGLEPLRCM
jgi:hypothetical protein